MPKLRNAFSLATRHLVKEHKLGFIAASEEIAKKRKKLRADLERFNRSFANGSPKMRLLAERKMLEGLSQELDVLNAHKTITVDLLLERGLVEQKIHDVKEMMKADRKKAGV